MANCGDLERNLRDMNRRIRDLERRNGGSGGGNNDQDIEEIIRKAVERVFKDNRWLTAVGLVGMLSTGKSGITSLNNLQSPAAATWKKGVEALNRSLRAESAAGTAKGKAFEALSKSADSQLKAKAARDAANTATNTVKTTNTIAKDAATTAKNAASQSKQTADQARRLAEGQKAIQELNKKNIAKEVQKVNTEIQKVVKEVDKKTKPLQDGLKKAQDAYKKVDDGLKRVTKGFDKFASAVGIGFGIAGVVISFMALFSSERNQAAFDRQVDRFQIDMSKQLSLLQSQKFRIDKLTKRTEVLEKEADLVSDAVIRARSIADSARKLANDITYEARVKIKKLNDITAQANSNASKALTQQTMIKKDISTVQTTIKTVDTKATKAVNEASQARNGVKLVDTKATLAQQAAQQATVGVKLVDSKATTALVTAQQLPAKIPSLIAPTIAPIQAKNNIQDSDISALKNSVKALQNTPKTNTPTTNTPTTNTPVINQAQINQALVNSGIPARLKNTELLATTALEQSAVALNKAGSEPIGRTALNLSTGNRAEIDKLNQDIQALKTPNLLEPRVRTIEGKVKEQEKVNQEANQKLDFQRNQLEQLLIATGGIGLMLPRILGSLDGIPDKTANAVAATPCNGKGCGGKTANKVDAVDNKLGDLSRKLDAFNAGANTVQLGMLRKIDATTTGNAAKLGVVQSTLATVGTAVDKTFTLLDKFTKWSRIGRAIQMLQTWMILHNALMLSNDLKVTLVSIVQNGYNFFKIKDENGEIIDVNTQLNQTIIGLIDGVIGTEARVDLTIAFKKANRIYQAAANVMYAVTAIVDITRTIAELGAERIGKVANALRAWGVVGDKAYGYMSEVVNPGTSTQEKINNLYSKAEPFQAGLNAVEVVSGVPQQTVDAFTGLAQAEKELELARQGRDSSGELIENQVKEANKVPEIENPVTVGRPE